jgi:hypothetical protein
MNFSAVLFIGEERASTGPPGRALNGYQTAASLCSLLFSNKAGSNILAPALCRPKLRRLGIGGLH